MSKATKRKHVTKEVLDEFVLPQGERQVVKVCSSRGNNLHGVETSTGETFLVSMPTKFRKNVWIKRGDFVMVEPIEEGDKVKAEISHILYREQIKYIKDEGLWPVRFVDSKAKNKEDAMIPADMLPPSGSDDEDEQEVSGDALLFSNPNRNVCIEADSDESSEED